MIEITIGSILGVLFHEALRIYRCFNAKKDIIPSTGLGKGMNFIIYLVVILIFILVSVFLANYFAEENGFAAFMFGMGIPSGMSYLKQANAVKQAESDEKVEDEWSDKMINKQTFFDKVKNWFNSYYV